MVQFFDLNDLVDFGYFLLSDERTNSIKANSEEALVGERLKQVYDADVRNWIELQEKFAKAKLQEQAQDEEQ